jgi:carboxyl-terminal processing protease
MRDYHVFSMESIDGEVTDHGVVLDVKDIPWSGRQLWAPDVACKDGKYYLYFPLKDKNDIFRIGVAVSDKPEGPFVPESDPIKGSFTIDPAVLNDNDQDYFIYFGGLLDEAVEIANYFLPRGKVIVTTKGKIKQASNTYKTLREPLDLEIPLAVLVNGGTASSSEILAGSLQDLDRAVIIGNRTFGKGLVQTTRPLPYGGTMKLTTSKYYIPSGRCVQAIDYKHRNEDGSVGRIPDSLTTVFHTAAGREVRDGGGVTPDIAVKQEKLPNILFYLVNDNLIFNYATDYCLKHPTIPSAEKFEITDADYADFKAMVKKADFKYDQQTEKMLKNLKEMAEFEGYLTDASKEFEALEKKLSHNLDRDLDHFSKDIKSMIAVEIIKRYYFQRGSIIQQLKDDDDLKEAVKILTAPEKYKEMLTAPAVNLCSNKFILPVENLLQNTMEMHRIMH